MFGALRNANRLDIHKHWDFSASCNGCCGYKKGAISNQFPEKKKIPCSLDRRIQVPKVETGARDSHRCWHSPLSPPNPWWNICMSHQVQMIWFPTGEEGADKHTQVLPRPAQCELVKWHLGLSIALFFVSRASRVGLLTAGQGLQ